MWKYFYVLFFFNTNIKSEETKNATLSAPRGLIYTCLATAVNGLVVILGFLYAMGNNI